MNKIHLVFFVIFFTCTSLLWGQETQWASQVLEVSSSYSAGFLFKQDLQYADYEPRQVLGRPNVLPGNSGDSPSAWVPQKPDREDFIKVGFDVPMKIQQIAIAESRNPGAVYQIYCYDVSGNEHLAATLEPAPVNALGRMFNVFIDPTTYEVNAVKIVLRGATVPGHNAIDAIAISSSSIPTTADINIASNLNPDLSLEKLKADLGEDLVNLNPIIAPDGNTIFFSRDSPQNVGGARDDEDIWYLERNPSTGEWGEPINAGSPLNNKGSNFVSAVALNKDGSYVLLLGNQYVEKGKMRGGVSLSSRKADGSWSEPTPMEIRDFYNYSQVANYFLSNDQKYLLMSLRRDDGYGDLDLYVSFNRGDNSWSAPLNLGRNINTADLESAPFMADDTTLYFSSQGYSGFGGEDVFVSHRLDDTWLNWSAPENLGPVINSESNDTYFNISVDNRYAFLTRGEVDSTGMYQMEMPIFQRIEPLYVIRGQVYNVKNNMPVEASVIFDNVADTITSSSSQGRTKGDGTYELTLPPGTYDIYAERDGFATLNRQRIALADLDPDGDKLVFRDIYLVDNLSTMNPDESLRLTRKAIASEEILFELESFALGRKAYGYLDGVAGFMQENPDVSIRVAGHTDSSGTDSYNQQLSEKRANAVADYLIHKGVPSSRIRKVGYGEKRPLVKNTSAANRQLNRRVEFVVIE
uniref:OmpA family protein n=1 Tax=Roseihalotalea indica TaxID=2867963 RepID=A0AA49GL26_9BACT|nr:OmpA family protein [Tunicatimonas sp. TK19036]